MKLSISQISPKKALSIFSFICKCYLISIHSYIQTSIQVAMYTCSVLREYIIRWFCIRMLGKTITNIKHIRRTYGYYYTGMYTYTTPLVRYVNLPIYTYASVCFLWLCMEQCRIGGTLPNFREGAMKKNNIFESFLVKKKKNEGKDKGFSLFSVSLWCVDCV